MQMGVLGVEELQKEERMPKVTITFNLPEEKSEYETCLNAGNYSALVYEFTNLLREKVKYGNETGSWTKAYEEWWNLLNEARIDPYDC
jgi:hypothetical protein